MSNSAWPERRIGIGVVLSTAAVLAGLAAAGCSSTVPQLWSFSSRTSDMSAGIRGGFARTDTLLQLADTPPAEIARFRSIRGHTTSTLSAVVEYSRTLAELASAGRQGKEAAMATAEALGGVVAVAGAPQAAGVTAATFAELAGAVAAVRARSSLAEAVRAAQPGVDTIAAILGRNLADLEDIAGAARMDAEARAFADHRTMLNYRRSLTRKAQRTDEVLTLYLDAQDGSGDALATLRRLDPDAPTALKDTRGFQQREAIWRTQARELDAELRRLEPEYSEYSARVQRIAGAGAGATATLRSGRAAVAAWARAHARIPEALDAGLQPSLVEFSAAAEDIANATRTGDAP